MLNETAPPVIGQPILDEFVRHLKISTPVDQNVRDEAEDALRASIAHIEAHLGLALIQRTFVWRGHVGSRQSVRAPMAPISELVAAKRVSADGESTPVDITAFLVDRTDLRARIIVRKPMLDTVELTFVAGFGAEWADTPADLRRAALMLAAHYFDNRHDVGDSGKETPHGVTALVAPWRPMRLRSEAAL